MGAALYIALERKIPGLDTTMDGKSLSRAQEQLDDLAKKLKVTPLLEFFSIDPGEAADFLGDEGGGAEDIDLPPLQHFPATRGLTSVRALLAQVRANPAGVPDADCVLTDLQECERILVAAEAQGIGFHFEVDY